MSHTYTTDTTRKSLCSTGTTLLYTVSQKNIPNISQSNLNKNQQILIFFNWFNCRQYCCKTKQLDRVSTKVSKT